MRCESPCGSMPIRMAPWPSSMAPAVWRATTRMAGSSSPRSSRGAGRTRPLGHATARSSILGRWCATPFRHTAEKDGKKNRTDHGLQKPDNLTCYLHKSSSHAWYVVSTYAVTRAGRASSAACPGKVRASRQARQLIGPTPPPHEWCCAQGGAELSVHDPST